MIETTTNKQVYIIADNPVFAFGIPFFSADNIHCYLYDGETEVELVRGEDFTVESKTDYSGGANVTLLIPLVAGRKLTITREVPMTQDVNLPEYGKLPVVPLEKQLDKIVMICQQLKDITSRAMTVPYGEEDVDTDEIYKMLLRTIANVREWATAAGNSATAAGNSATAAGNSATAAGNSATAAQGHASNAGASENNAYSYASTAAMAANSAVAAADEIREIDKRATLNLATLAFGDWGGEGVYVSYNEWTDVESLIAVAEKIAEHNADTNAHELVIAAHNGDPTAHNDIRNLVGVHNTSLDAHSNLFSAINDLNMSKMVHNSYYSRQVMPIANTIQTVEHHIPNGRQDGLTNEELERARIEVRLWCKVANNGYSKSDYAILAEAIPHPVLTKTNILIASGEKIQIYKKNSFEKIDIPFDVSYAEHQWNYEFRIWY